MRSKNRNQKVSKTRVNMRKNKSISGKLKRRKTKTRRNRRRKIVGGNLDKYYNKLVSEFNSHSGNWTFKNLLDNVFGVNNYDRMSPRGEDRGVYGLTNNITKITKKDSQSPLTELIIEVGYDGLDGKGLVSESGPQSLTYTIYFDDNNPNKIAVKDSRDNNNNNNYAYIYEKKN